MENTTEFDLNEAIRNWRENLNGSPQICAENIAELESHLRDSVADLQSRGLTPEEAFLLAARRLGGPARLEPEFAKVNRGQAWVHRLVWMLVGIQVWGFVMSFSRLFAGLTVVGAAAGLGIQFPRAYPFSAASLASSGVFGLANLLALVLCLVLCWWLMSRKEDATHRLAVKALHQPMLLGVGSAVFLLGLSACSFLPWSLMARVYSPEAYGNIAAAQSYAWLLLGPLQSVALIAATIFLFRQRLRLSRV